MDALTRNNIQLYTSVVYVLYIVSFPPEHQLPEDTITLSSIFSVALAQDLDRKFSDCFRNRNV